jgi:hypothetical protein
MAGRRRIDRGALLGDGRRMAAPYGLIANCRLLLAKFSRFKA